MCTRPNCTSLSSVTITYHISLSAELYDDIQSPVKGQLKLFPSNDVKTLIYFVTQFFSTLRSQTFLIAKNLQVIQ